MKVIAVTDRKLVKGDFLLQLMSVTEAGVDMLVLREKDLTENEYLALANDVRSVCAENDADFCVNTFSGVAEDVRADALWVPFGQFVKEGRRAVLKEGVSVHSEEEAYRAMELGADFIVYGNVYETSCKPGKPGKGLDELRMICINSDIPVYAIGGINEGNLQEVHDCGVDGVCMMSAFMETDDPQRLVKAVRSVLE